MSIYVPVTDADLVRARKDSAFREKMLRESLDALLERLRELRRAASADGKNGAKQVREGVELAVQLADLMQKPARRRRNA